MSVADKLLQVNQVKQDIKTAIENKGIPMTDVAFTEYANKILEIEGGGDFYELWFEFFGATTKEEKMISLNKLTYMLIRNGYTAEADEVNNYRDVNDLWPTVEETIILGVLGEPAELTLLSRYDGAESYFINPQKTTNGNFEEWHWDDSKWPFNEITDYTDSYGNKFKKIPKMYIKLAKDANGVINERYISNVKVDNDYQLPKCFIDQDTLQELPYFYIGTYEGSLNGDKYESKSGKTVIVDSTLDDFRTWATNYNRIDAFQYHIFDMHIKFVLETLYLIVFANTNSDELFPQGATGSSNQSTGVMDGMVHHTGYRTDLTNYPMKFLGIENYFANTRTQVDGVKLNNREVFVCDNPRLYNSSSNTTDYYSIGNTASDGYIKELGTANGLFSIPLTGGGVDGKWYSDSLYTGTSYRTLYFGRTRNFSAAYGLFSWSGSFDFSNSTSYSGSRLVKKPLP